MSNADDSPASENGREDPSGRDQAASESETDGSEKGGSSLDLGTGSASSASSDDSSGISLPEPSSVQQDDDADEPSDGDEATSADEERAESDQTAVGGFRAQSLDDDTDSGDARTADPEAPADTPLSQTPYPEDADPPNPVDEDAEPAAEESDEEIYELDGDDLIIESAEEDRSADLSADAELDLDEDEREEAPIDDGPTRVSESPPAGGLGDDSSGLSDLADEMQSSMGEDSSGDAHEEPKLGDGDSTPEDERDDYDPTRISATDAESGTVDQAAPAVESDGEGTIEQAAPPAGRSGSVPENPPPPEQTGSATTGSTPSSAPTAEASLEEDLSGEHAFSSLETELFDSPFENDPIYPRLTVLDGPSSGQEFLLNKLRNAIGRSTANTVSIPDEAMSRQHVELIRNPDDSYTIRDLQSVNGTLLNGTKIREADLFHGDRIEVGKTTLQFVIPGQRPGDEDARSRHIEPAPAESGGDAPGAARRPTGRPAPVGDDAIATWLNRIIFGALALLIPLAGTFLYLTVSDPAPESTAAGSQRREARNAYLAGVKAVKRRKWDKAREHFEKARSLDPAIADIEAQIDRLASEKSAQQCLREAREALEEGADERALHLAESIPHESVYYEDAREIVRRQRRKRRIESLYRQAENQFGDQNYQTALATIQRILNTIPNHGDALNLRRRILHKTDADLDAAKQKAREKDETADTNSAGGPHAAASAGTTEDSNDSWLIDEPSGSDSSGGGGSSSGSGRVVNFTKGFTLYRRTDFDAAIAHFKDAAGRSDGSVGERARSAAKQIRNFRSHYQSAEKTFSSGDWESAIEAYRKALRADKEVASSGFFTTELKRKIAEARAKLGFRAFENGDYIGAFNAYKQARDNDESVDAVRQLRRKLEKKARSLYIRAANKRKTDPEETAAMCRTITSIVPPSSENYQKARKLLDEL